MDFIEQLFGVSPDGGSGLTEVSIVVAIFAALALGYLLRAHRKHNAAG